MRVHISTAVWAFVDLLFNVLLVTLYINGLLAIPNPKAKAAEIAGVTPGKMCVELYWPDNLDIDIDLWGRSPNGSIVGYSHKSSDQLDLLRDTLGHMGNPSGRNFEMMCSGALNEGTWTFNAHYYMAHQTPIPADVPISLVINFPMSHAGDGNKQIVSQGVLRKEGEELTLVDFELNKDGRVVPGSTNHVQQPLRSSIQGGVP